MRTHVILILLIVSCMSFASTEGSYQQRVNPKFKVGVVEINRDDLIRKLATILKVQDGEGRKRLHSGRLTEI